MNLTPFGGPQNGFVQDFAIQEIDIKTNKLLFFWSALQHLPLADSFMPASRAFETSNVWDAYHFNSIGLTDSKCDILVSSRNTWTIFRINKQTGKIIWCLGGKQSNFKFANGANFSWQHDARMLSCNTISLFDDNCCESDLVPPGTPSSHGLILKLDYSKMTAYVERAYFHDPVLHVSSQGNLQSLPNGNKFIGWGQSQYFSEFANAGNTPDDPAQNLLYDAQMPGNNYTYRAYRLTWVGKPCYPPSIAVIKNNEQVTVYASWNGATEVAAWQFLSGRCPDKLATVKTVKKSGFETALTIDNDGPCFQVRAVNSCGKVIGVSRTIKLAL